MRARDSKRLVIDADVAQAAGSETATHPRARHCRDFLDEVLTLSHRVVMTERINNEWKNHQSRFAPPVASVNGCTQKNRPYY